MRSANLPQCCGIVLVSDFGNTQHALNSYKYNCEQVSNFLDNEIKFARSGRQSMVMATLNDEQMETIGSVFRKKGFRRVANNFHKNHNSTIYVLVKKLTYE